MNKPEKIRKAYKGMGGEATFYDNMITCSSFLGRLVSRLVWDMNQQNTRLYQEKVHDFIPKDFSGKLLEVPVGTGIITMPWYKQLPKAEITCLDYSTDMMARAERLAAKLNLQNIRFMQGDVGHLTFENDTFDMVTSLNGFHVFPDKEAAYAETYRVLKPGGIFCGCFGAHGINWRHDWIIDHIYTPKGYCTPPYDTVESLRKRLEEMYKNVQIFTVKTEVIFRAEK